ncbi:helix-turn-helix domain-containing protein [Streptomyces sp. NPDC090306]|uniref:helix-turn-helix domain-containing protein n=1 Tax=Streptomyces sp. NPDC090306 TaxID=3365961 RepID=UPI0038084557
MPAQPPQRESRSLDARSLRGLAHPLRMRLLDELRRSGSATASQLGARLGESSGSTSYHLRQLAAHGFVEDDTGRGKGRERWWRPTPQGVTVEEDLLNDPDPAVRGAVEVFLRELASAHQREVSAYLDSRDHEGPAWRHASDLSDFTLRLTPRTAQELIEKMHELVDGYTASAARDDDPSARRVRVHTHVLPFTPDRPEPETAREAST